jgi:hypothetical protein
VRGGNFRLRKQLYSARNDFINLTRILILAEILCRALRLIDSSTGGPDVASHYCVSADFESVGLGGMCRSRFATVR